MFAEHFVSTHQQVGDFRAVKVGSAVTKQGGNVASHFLTADGRVIHSVTGPVSADKLLEEAEWALQMYEEALQQPPTQVRAYVAWAHQQAANFGVGQDRQVHELLMANPLPPLSLVFDEIFEDILGQRVSTAAPRLAQAAVRLRIAKESGRPLLLVFYEGHEPPLANAYSELAHQLLRQYVVIAMPLKDAPALSQLTERPPYDSPSSARPLFVIARSDGEQLDALAGWNDHYLTQALASGWVDALERNPPGSRDLTRVTRMLDKHYPALADRTRALTIRVQQQAREAREAAAAERRAEREAARDPGTPLAGISD